LPLLSHEIVDLSWRIPVSMKVKNNVSKWALRQVLYKYVPQKLIDRPKMGFSVPVAQWLRSDLNEWAGDLFATADNSGVLQMGPIKEAWGEHINGKRDHSHRLWTVLMFLAWADNRKR
jgi:asparagine synthase (glutamine-hydrolysing)